MPRDWRAEVDELSDVQRLVHLAMRYDPTDEERIYSELLRTRRQAYESELTMQAARVGCAGRRGALGNNPSLKALSDASKQDAQSIANTYNYDLAKAIKRIGEEVPTANRHVYASRLSAWDKERAGWKREDIAQYTESSARAQAQQDFYSFNAIHGVAVLVPTSAVCPVCQGWIKRGEVPLREAQNHPPPYHVKCPHYWQTIPNQVAKEECPLLWMGE